MGFVVWKRASLGVLVVGAALVLSGVAKITLIVIKMIGIVLDCPEWTEIAQFFGVRSSSRTILYGLLYSQASPVNWQNQIKGGLEMNNSTNELALKHECKIVQITSAFMFTPRCKFPFSVIMIEQFLTVYQNTGRCTEGECGISLMTILAFLETTCVR